MKKPKTSRPPKPDFWGAELPIAIAHRGGAGQFSLDRSRRENTLEAFQAAHKLGYEYLELDVTTTADKKVIALHVTADKFEALLHKPSAPVAEKLLRYSHAELQKLLGRDVPTLETILKALPDCYFLIDAKTDAVVEPLAEVIEKTKSIERVYLNSFFYERVRKLQQLLGHDLECGVIIGRHPRLFNRRLQALLDGQYFHQGFSAITIPRRFLNKRMVSLIHRHGLKVLVWAPNTEKHIQKALKLRADGIISDNIILLKQIMDGRSND